MISYFHHFADIERAQLDSRALLQNMLISPVDPAYLQKRTCSGNPSSYEQMFCGKCSPMLQCDLIVTLANLALASTWRCELRQFIPRSRLRTTFEPWTEERSLLAILPKAFESGSTSDPSRRLPPVVHITISMYTLLVQGKQSISQGICLL